MPLGRAKEIGPLAFPRDLSGTPRIAAEIDAGVTRVYPPRNQASESGPRSEPALNGSMIPQMLCFPARRS